MILSKIKHFSNWSEKPEKQCLYNKKCLSNCMSLSMNLIPEIHRQVKILSELYIRTLERHQLVNWPFSLKCVQHFSVFPILKFCILSKADSRTLGNWKREKEQVETIQNQGIFQHHIVCEKWDSEPNVCYIIFLLIQVLLDYKKKL